VVKFPSDGGNDLIGVRSFRRAKVASIIFRNLPRQGDTETRDCPDVRRQASLPGSATFAMRAEIVEGLSHDVFVAICMARRSPGWAGYLRPSGLSDVELLIPERVRRLLKITRRDATTITNLSCSGLALCEQWRRRTATRMAHA
jgi:hypothetical protein